MARGCATCQSQISRQEKGDLLHPAILKGSSCLYPARCAFPPNNPESPPLTPTQHRLSPGSGGSPSHTAWHSSCCDLPGIAPTRPATPHQVAFEGGSSSPGPLGPKSTLHVATRTVLPKPTSNRVSALLTSLLWCPPKRNEHKCPQKTCGSVSTAAQFSG